MKFGYIDKNHMKAARLMPTPLAPKYLIINGESGAFAFLLNHFLGTGFSISPQRDFFAKYRRRYVKIHHFLLLGE